MDPERTQLLPLRWQRVPVLPDCPMNETTIATLLGVTRGYVNQLLNSAYLKLRARLEL